MNGEKVKDEIPSREGIFRFSVDELIKDLIEIIRLRIDKILLFRIISNEDKDERGSRGILPAIKKQFPQIIIFTDICLCGLIRNSDVD